MSAFDNSEFKKHKAEAKEKWEKNDAYKEYAKKRSIIQKRSGIILPKE